MTRVELAHRVAELGREAEEAGLMGGAAVLGGLAGVLEHWTNPATEPALVFVRCVIQAFTVAANHLDRPLNARVN